jgi:hypothetical protein
MAAAAGDHRRTIPKETLDSIMQRYLRHGYAGGLGGASVSASIMFGYARLNSNGISIICRDCFRQRISSATQSISGFRRCVLDWSLVGAAGGEEID